MVEEKRVLDATPTILNFQLGHPTFILQDALFSLEPLLNGGDIRRGRAFFALLYVEGNSIAFFERLEAVSLDRGMMNKYIRTALLSNEAEALLVIEPLNCSIRHSDTLLSIKF